MNDGSLVITEAFCGCCGNTAGYDEQDWCANCLPHVADVGPSWLRTFYGQFGRECPLQV